MDREKLSDWFKPSCHIILFNFAMTDWSLDAPLLVKNYENENITNANKEFIWVESHNLNICFNTVILVLYKS